MSVVCVVCCVNCVLLDEVLCVVHYVAHGNVRVVLLLQCYTALVTAHQAEVGCCDGFSRSRAQF